jgi:hypothetical protein
MEFVKDCLRFPMGNKYQTSAEPVDEIGAARFVRRERMPRPKTNRGRQADPDELRSTSAEG